MHMNMKRATPSRTPSRHTASGSPSHNTAGGSTQYLLGCLFVVCVTLVGWQTIYMTPSKAVHDYSSSLEAYLSPGMMPRRISVFPNHASNGMENSYYDTLGIPHEVATVIPPIIDDNFLAEKPLPVYDRSTVSPAVFRSVVQLMNARSIIDVGCGRGYASTWWDFHNVTTITSVDRYRLSGTTEKGPIRIGNTKSSAMAAAYRKLKNTNTMHNIVQVRNSYTQHDYALGPWWPSGPTYDVAWALDFIPHISLDHVFNYMQTFRKAGIIIVSWSPYWPSAPNNANESKLELHSDAWWRKKFESQGLLYRDDWTAAVRNWALEERKSGRLGPDGKPLNARHLWLHTHVFINPVVMSLPQHQQLLPDLSSDNRNNPHHITADMDIAWTNYWQNRVTFPAKDDPAMEASWKEVLAKFQAAGDTRNGLHSASSPPYTKIAPDAIPVVPMLQNFERHKFPNATVDGARKERESISPIPVVAWPYVKLGIRTAEHLHMEQDAIEQSPYLQMSTDLSNFDENVVWLGDIGCCSKGWIHWCEEYASLAQEAQDKRRELGLPLYWPIFIVDFTDGVSLPHCPAVEEVVGTRNVKYTTRSVGRREWDEAQNWTQYKGALSLTKDGHKYLHTPLVVRTDTIAALNEDLRKQEVGDESDIKLPLTLASPLERLERPVDVSHFWPVGDQLKLVGTVKSQLRTRVGDILLQMQTKNPDWNIFLGLKGSPVKTGRRGVKEVYIEGLLESKIVVVSQRDAWEDHYRLMEALVGGAMVMTDRMVGLPNGLKNGTSVIEFDSAASLENLVTYYLTHPEERLAIAKEGRHVAMTRHRTWHRVEEVIFGHVLSNCQYQPAGSLCPYVVTGPESQR